MKKVSSLQKQRQNKQLLMSELESLEDKLKSLSSKAEKTRRKTTSKRQNTQNLNSILDRWKTVNAQPNSIEMEPSTPAVEEVHIEEPVLTGILQNQSSFLLPVCEELEKSVLKQMKACIQLILRKTAKVDSVLMSLIAGTNETIDDYEKLYQQLKLMVFMDKMNQGTARNELMAFIFSSM